MKLSIYKSLQKLDKKAGEYRFFFSASGGLGLRVGAQAGSGTRLVCCDGTLSGQSADYTRRR